MLQTVINFSTPPEWLFATPAPVAYPTDPNQVVWNYEQGVHAPNIFMHASIAFRLRGVFCWAHE